MSPSFIITIIAIYFAVLFSISWFTSRGADNQTFFIGDKKSPWYLVAFGMIGASLSGVTFLSVPGAVDGGAFGYMQVVFGYLVGYFVIAYVLMPIYYRLNLTSIYVYLKGRFGVASYKTGASFFLLSRILGAAFRLYLVADILQAFIFDAWGVPYVVTVAVSILLIWLYTFRGGIRTIIFTDALQTFFMLLAVGLTIWLIKDDLGWSISDLISNIAESDKSQMIFHEDVNATTYWLKQFLAGVFIAICMTGLDQDMMQKNLSCKNIEDAQKNMVSFSVVLVFVNFIFLALGALFYLYAAETGLELPLAENGTIKADRVYATVALHGELGITVGIVFILGLVAAAYSSADSALTSLTTSFCVDVLEIDKDEKAMQERKRKWTHVGMSVVLLLVIVIFKYVLQESVINELLRVAAYTYGPLLGLYAFGIFTKMKPIDMGVPIICIASPILTYFVSEMTPYITGGFRFGSELIILNGGFTFLMLWFLSAGNVQRNGLPSGHSTEMA